MAARVHLDQAVQLEASPLPLDSSKAFPQAAGAQWNFSTLHFVRMIAALHT